MLTNIYARQESGTADGRRNGIVDSTKKMQQLKQLDSRKPQYDGRRTEQWKGTKYKVIDGLDTVTNNKELKRRGEMQRLSEIHLKISDSKNLLACPLRSADFF